MLGVFAEFETNLRRERQLEGIAKAKAKGVYKGRPKKIDDQKIRALKADGMKVAEICLEWIFHVSLSIVLSRANGGSKSVSVLYA